ncbi:MAG: GNAT family N-acetyltransferase [Acidimicrobiales bacterium]
MAEPRDGRDGPRRFRYCIDLRATARRPIVDRSAAVDGSGVTVRPPIPADRDRLAELMLASFRHTIDYEGEEIEQTTETVAEYLRQAALLDYSRLALVGGTAVSAVLAGDYDGAPYISYVMSAPEFRRRGICRSLVAETLARMERGGLVEVHLAITEGNVASEGLFRSFGAYVDHPRSP